MNIFDKIEHLFNWIFGIIFEFIYRYIEKFIPDSFKGVFGKVSNYKSSLGQKVSSKLTVVDSIKNQMKKVEAIAAKDIEEAQKAKDELETAEGVVDKKGLGFVSKIKLIFAAIIREQVNFLKSKADVVQNYMKALTLAKIFGVIAILIIGHLSRIKVWFAALTPNAIVFGSGIAIITATAVTTIISSGTNIYISSSYREPASIPELKSGRPVYYKGEKKLLSIRNLRMSIYQPKFKDMKILTIDVTLKASNRQIINYLNSREHILRDRLIEKVEPILPSFTLLPEGKEILKNKIQEVLDSYIKESKIDGAIEDVYVEYLMGV